MCEAIHYGFYWGIVFYYFSFTTYYAGLNIHMVDIVQIKGQSAIDVYFPISIIGVLITLFLATCGHLDRSPKKKIFLIGAAGTWIFSCLM